MRPPAAWARWLRWLPCALLVAVASQQMVLAHSVALSPWSGGGFGMFSSSDAGPRRHLHFYALRPGIERELALPAELVDRARRARTLPSPARLRELARILAALESPDHGPARAIRVRVWRTEFDPRTLTPSGHILRELELPLVDEQEP